MTFLVRKVPLDGGDATYHVRYAPEAVDEIAERDDAERLMDELEYVLARTPLRSPGRRTKKLKGAKGLMRYRPRIDNATRVFYAIEGHEVWVLALYPRSQAYRPHHLGAARARLDRARE